MELLDFNRAIYFLFFVVDIPNYLGVYGHPQYPISKYKLTVTIYKPTTDPFAEGFADSQPPPSTYDDISSGADGNPAEDYDLYGDERSAFSLLWPVISGILEIAIDVLL